MSKEVVVKVKEVAKFIDDANLGFQVDSPMFEVALSILPMETLTAIIQTEIPSNIKNLAQVWDFWQGVGLLDFKPYVATNCCGRVELVLDWETVLYVNSYNRFQVALLPYYTSLTESINSTYELETALRSDALVRSSKYFSLLLYASLVNTGCYRHCFYKVLNDDNVITEFAESYFKSCGLELPYTFDMVRSCIVTDHRTLDASEYTRVNVVSDSSGTFRFVLTANEEQVEVEYVKDGMSCVKSLRIPDLLKGCTVDLDSNSCLVYLKDILSRIEYTNISNQTVIALMVANMAGYHITNTDVINMNTVSGYYAENAVGVQSIKELRF